MNLKESKARIAEAKRVERKMGTTFYVVKTDTTTGVGGSGIKKVAHNYKLNNGGLERPPLYNYKEYIKNHNFSKGRSASSKSIKSALTPYR